MSVKMKDVAARAGVSTQTVSRVIRGHQWVAPETAARVRAAMIELGYHGNEVAGALKRGHTRTFGLLLPLLTTSIWADVAVGAEAVAHNHGYSVLLCDTSGPIDKEAAYLSLLLSQRVAGIVYVQPRCSPDSVPAAATLVTSGPPTVVISGNIHDLPFPHIRTDDERAGYVAVRHLVDLGRRRIGVVGSGSVQPSGQVELSTVSMHDRIAGAHRAITETHADASTLPSWVGPNSIEGGYAAAIGLLDSGDELPDGIFATTDALALGMLEAFRTRGIRVPEDVALVAHDGLLASSVSVPSLTTIAPSQLELGRTSITFLLDALKDDSHGGLCVLDAQFLVRESTLGLGPAARLGCATPLSDAEAWSRWRSRLPEVASAHHGGPAVLPEAADACAL